MLLLVVIEYWSFDLVHACIDALARRQVTNACVSVSRTCSVNVDTTNHTE